MDAKRPFRNSGSSEVDSLDLLCLPSAGGNSSLFKDWARHLPKQVNVRAVELPGRMSRFKEPPVSRVETLVQLLARELEPSLEGDFALFGHSMGALIAFELTRELRRRGKPTPAHLFVSGYPAPHLPRPPTSIHNLPKQFFLNQIAYLIPPEALRDTELLEMILPTLRADFALCETYRYVPEPPLDCPITALGGACDWVVNIYGLDYWRFQTNSFFNQQIFIGDHFYLQHNPPELFQMLTMTLLKK